MSGIGPGRLRVLVVATHEPWPLDHGGRLRLFHFIERIARHAEVTLALPGPAQYAEQLPEGVRTVAMSTSASAATALPANGRSPSLVGRMARRHFGENGAIDAWLRRYARPAYFDVALFSGAILGLHVGSARVPVVWDGVDELVLYTLRDAQYGEWRRWPRALRHALLYAAYERDAARGAAVTMFSSTVDAALARRWVGGARVEVVSNGVDLDYFRPSVEAPEPGTLAFVGALDFPPNVDAVTHFARRVWPRLHARGSGRRLLLVGRRPVPAVKSLGAVSGVELAADVPDVRPYLSRAAGVVVPTRLGGGVKNKILEGCAACRPVIASPRALAGLSARVGVEVLGADKPDSWVHRVDCLLKKPAWAARVARAGHAWVRKAHRWSTLGDRLADILASAGRRTAPVRRD